MMQSNELCVPESALAQQDEGEQTPAVPQPGDEVELTIKGKVTRAEGGNVYLTPTEANGEPIEQGNAKGPADAEPAGDDQASIENMLAGARSGGGGGSQDEGNY